MKQPTQASNSKSNEKIEISMNLKGLRILEKGWSIKYGLV